MELKGTCESTSLALQLKQMFMATVFAKLTKVAAKPADYPAPEGFIDMSQNREFLASFSLTPEDLLIPFTHFKVKVFAKDPKVWHEYYYPPFIFAFKGTGILHLDDWANNIKQARRQKSIYYQQTLKIARAVLNSGKKDLVCAVGHSLGGGLASAFSRLAQVDAITYNAAGIDPEALGIDCQSKSSRIDAYYVKGEALQALQHRLEHRLDNLSFYRFHLDLSKIRPLPQTLGAMHVVNAGLTSIDKHFVRTVMRGLNKELLALRQRALEI
ncbi:hypothetical protein CJP74_07205 [Psittacicella melopsittaci]|uniref:DUF2974 domain-containing protein n=2 Tax=Psittacicella melopsittaci TaxID=2028576 RepID=A0A3A1Y203_9GAMM|nr:hypothetical protein CJP74_07205 [Psittacicella melopsittaci]